MYKLHESRYDIFIAAQLVEKVCFFKKSACSQSLSPNPFPRERGYITGATAPRPCRGLRPKARMLWLLAKSFARGKTNRASNTRHPIFKNYIGFSTACTDSFTAVRFGLSGAIRTKRYLHRKTQYK